ERELEQEVADNAAETGGERPVQRGFHASREARREDRAEQPCGGTHAHALEIAVRNEAPAPDGDWKNEDDGSEAHDLHQAVGEDRAGATEQIPRGSVGGVIVAR